MNTLQGHGSAVKVAYMTGRPAVSQGQLQARKPRLTSPQAAPRWELIGSCTKFAAGRMLKRSQAFTRIRQHLDQGFRSTSRETARANGGRDIRRQRQRATTVSST